jgi:hypothetical protein
MRRKRKVVEAIVPARKRELRLVPVRRIAVAEVDRQRPGLEYARTQRSQKSGGESERGPSRGEHWR